MARKQKTWKIGRRVQWRYFSAAVSCQSSRLISGVGKITGIEDGRYVIDKQLLVSASEIKGYANG